MPTDIPAARDALCRAGDGLFLLHEFNVLEGLEEKVPGQAAPRPG
jgi:hypothetical protein